MIGEHVKSSRERRKTMGTIDGCQDCVGIFLDRETAELGSGEPVEMKIKGIVGLFRVGE